MVKITLLGRKLIDEHYLKRGIPPKKKISQPYLWHKINQKYESHLNEMRQEIQKIPHTSSPETLKGIYQNTYHYFIKALSIRHGITHPESITIYKVMNLSREEALPVEIGRLINKDIKDNKKLKPINDYSHSAYKKITFLYTGK
jgi:hypothetical protein